MSLRVFYVSRQNVLVVTSPALAVYRPGNYRSGSKKSREMCLGGVMSRGHRSRGVITNQSRGRGCYVAEVFSGDNTAPGVLS